MKLILMEIEVMFKSIDTDLFDIEIVNNAIRIKSKENIPFSNNVLNYLRNEFDKNSFICDFDDNTNSIIHIIPTEEGLFAEIRTLVSSSFVQFGYVHKSYNVAVNEEEED